MNPDAGVPLDLLADFRITWWEAALRLVLALILGGVVGWEREVKGRAAGLRTYMMVCLGSAGFTVVALDYFTRLPVTPMGPSGDPARIMAAVVGGIGFLGAGAIIRAGGSVRGLTTAAGLWVIAAVGVAAGAGHYPVAIITTLLALVTLTYLKRAEQLAHKHHVPEADVDEVAD